MELVKERVIRGTNRTILEVESDPVLLQQFLGGSNEAFALLYKRHTPKLMEFCLRVVRERALAEDIIQTMWERVIQLRRSPREIKNPASYFFIIARNLAYERTSSRYESVPLDGLEEMANTSSYETANNFETAVEEAMELLPPKYKEVLTLQLFSGYKLDEVADLLEISPDAVYARASRARKMLREIVAKKLKQ